MKNLIIAILLLAACPAIAQKKNFVDTGMLSTSMTAAQSLQSFTDAAQTAATASLSGTVGTHTSQITSNSVAAATAQSAAGAAQTTATNALTLGNANATIVTVLSGGTLVTTGTLKTYYAVTTSTSSSTVGLNLTTDNTATGTPIFSTILFNSIQVMDATSTPTAAISGRPMPESSDKKTVSYLLWKSGNAVLSVLGTAAQTFQNAPAGTAVRVKIIGL